MKHIFLTGPKQVGKSTVIQKVITMLVDDGLSPLSVHGFMTFWDSKDASGLYIADAGRKGEPRLLGIRRDNGIELVPRAFDDHGAQLLTDAPGARIILMDELGFLEGESLHFQEAVFACLDGDVPILGVLREGDVPWHAPIKTHPGVSVYLVSQANRDALPAIIASSIL